MDLFKPQVSVITKGLAGKSLLIYGKNRLGKTSNCAAYPGAVVFAFEMGLNAISGTKFFPMTKWSDWTDAVRKLTNPFTAEKFKKEVGTVLIIDTVEAMCDLAEQYICSTFNTTAVSRGPDGKKSFGYWEEFRKTLKNTAVEITKAGFTVIFISHTDDRAVTRTDGTVYNQIYPSGDKKTVDVLLNTCDIIAYVEAPPANDEGVVPKATMHLDVSMAYRAGTRYKYLVSEIPEWNLEKLDDAIAKAVEMEEKEGGSKALDFEKVRAAQLKAAAEAEKTRPTIEQLINIIGTKVTEMVQKDGNKLVYDAILENIVGNKDFRAQEATERQREQLELIITSLEEKGY